MITLFFFFNDVIDILFALITEHTHSNFSDYWAFAPSIIPINYWKERAQQYIGQVTNNPHILAARIISRVESTGDQVTADDINSVLASQNHSITQDELDELKSLPVTSSYNFENLAHTKTTVRSDFKLPPSWGLYSWTNTITNALYWGSSTALFDRLPHYWKNHSSSLRNILADIKATGLNHFTLDVIVFPPHLREMRLLLALEQYYLLSQAPTNNTLYVAAGSPGGMRLAE